MQKNKIYDLLIIGGGISSSVFASFHIKNGFIGSIAIIEAGRRLGGRSSTRKSRFNKGWELNHGSPNLNIVNSSNNPFMDNFIKGLLTDNIIQSDSTDLVELNENKKFNLALGNEFYDGKKYTPKNSMSELCEDIISQNNLKNQIDFYFDELIINLKLNKNYWILSSKKGNKYIAKFIVLTSNLLLHKRSLKILATNEIPLRIAIPQKLNKKIDLLMHLVNDQDYIQRLTFLIYTNSSYRYKDHYLKKYRYFLLNDYLEKKYKFERIIFQKQKNNNLGVVIHTRNIELIKEYLESINEFQFKKNLLLNFNNLFDGSNTINRLIDYKDISIMRWRASQPLGKGIPDYFQVCDEQQIGFCGDWFNFEGYGRIEGAISSALNLSLKINSKS